MRNIKLIFVIPGIVVLLILSEAVFVGSHKWVLYSYLLKAAKLLNNAGRTDAAFFVATEGKYTLPNNITYRYDAKEDIKTVSPYYNLPAFIYVLAVTAYNDRLTDLTPELLNISIKMDPDFSFWRVELANYYLLSGNIPLARKTLEDCIKLDSARQHCQDYMTNVFNNNSPQEVGFLSGTVKDIFEVKGGL